MTVFMSNKRLGLECCQTDLLLYCDCYALGPPRNPDSSTGQLVASILEALCEETMHVRLALFRLKHMQMMIMAMAHVGGLFQNAHQACPAASLTG